MTLVLTLAAALTLGAPLDQQRRPGAATPQQTGVPIAIALKAGAQTYEARGQGQCRHAAQASIYGTPAEMWSVQHETQGKTLNVTVWRPRSGDSMLNLSIAIDSKRYSVSTVRVGSQGAPTGTGSVTFASSAKGGTFTIAATTQEGAKIAGTIACDAFTPLVAEGGEAP